MWHFRDVGYTPSGARNHRFTSDNCYRFGLLGTWGVSTLRTLQLGDLTALKKGIPILLSTSSYP